MNYPYKNFIRGLTVHFTSPRYFFASSHPITTAANIHSRVDRSRYVLFRSTIHSIEEGKNVRIVPCLTSPLFLRSSPLSSSVQGQTEK